MVTPFVFTKIPQIYFGCDQFLGLPALLTTMGQNLLLVTGKKSIQKTDLWGPFIQEISDKGLVYEMITEQGEPTPEFVDEAVERFRCHKIEVVVAIGGGSVIDTGKAISAMLTKNESVMDYLEGIGTRVHDGHKIPFVAVPTTSGTGSEATKNAVLRHVGENGFKRSLRHDNFVPDVAVVDPSLIVTCPESLTASVGMDAFTQLMEAYLSSQAMALTDALAYDGLVAVKKGLKQCYYQPQDIQARSQMAYAALLSGITLAHAGLGMVHGFATEIGGIFDIPHGVVCGTLMGAVNRVTVQKLLKGFPEHPALQKYARLGRLFREDKSVSAEQACQSLIKTLDTWTEELKIPRLKDFGVDQNSLEKIVEKAGSKNHPIPLEREEMMKILAERL